MRSDNLLRILTSCATKILTRYVHAVNGASGYNSEAIDEDPGVGLVFEVPAIQGASMFRKIAAATNGLLLTISFAGPLEAHDLFGLRAQRSIEAKMPSDRAEELRRREELREPSDQTKAISNELKRSDGLPATQSAPGGPAPRPSRAFQNLLEQVMNARARWPHRQTLSVCFFNGSSASRTQFMRVLREEVALTNLSVSDEVSSCTGAASAAAAPTSRSKKKKSRPTKVSASVPSIRVSFTEEGYWSYIGTDALLVPRDFPTLNLQGFGNRGDWSASDIGTARHEIGHALALLHEHQNPQIDCKFRSDEEIASIIGWTKQEVANNFDRIRNTANLIVTDYDPKSIMHYQLPASYFSDPNSPCLLSAKNNILSPGDVSILRSAYPK